MTDPTLIMKAGRVESCMIWHTTTTPKFEYNASSREVLSYHLATVIARNRQQYTPAFVRTVGRSPFRSPFSSTPFPVQPSTRSSPPGKGRYLLHGSLYHPH